MNADSIGSPPITSPLAPSPPRERCEHAAYVVGDVHGHLEQLRCSLQIAGLVSRRGHWSGGQANVWFLGDLVDRGPEGLGVIAFVRRLGDEARKVGGEVNTVLGNHEIMLLAAHHFGDRTNRPSVTGFRTHWLRNGGQPADLDRLTDDQIDWLVDRPAITLLEDHLLLHADTSAYLDYGRSVHEINRTIRNVLTHKELDQWRALIRRMTRREEFARRGGAATAKRLRRKLGGQRIVHGHTPIPDMLGVDPPDVTAAHVYAAGMVIATDGGIIDGGPCLVTRLPVPA